MRSVLRTAGLSLLLLLCPLLQLAHAQAPKACACLDLLLVIDSSQSITPATFKNILNGAAQTIREYSVNPVQVRVGYLTYSGSVGPQIGHFNYSTGVDVVMESLQALPYTPGIANITAGLAAAYELLLTETRGDSQKVLQLWSSGQLTPGCPDPVPVADRIRADFGAQIIGIGFENIYGQLQPADYDRLLQIAGNSPANVVNSTAPEGSDAYKLVPQLNALTDCNATACTPSICTADLAFLIESSQRTAPLVPQMLNMVAYFLQSLPASYVGENVALASYSSPSVLHVPLPKDNSQVELSAYLSSWSNNTEPYIGLSDMNAGLQVIESQVFNAAAGDRSNHQNILVMISSGYLDPSAPNPVITGTAAAVRARTAGQSGIYAVEYPVDPEQPANRQNLVNVAGDPYHVYTGETSQLDIIVGRIKQQLIGLC